jgi:hypothetical protein
LRIYHNIKYIDSGFLFDNLYKLCLDYSFSESLLFLNVTDVKRGIKRNREGEYSSKLWHCKLGHISRDRM